jgi:hypothetical protein
MADDLDDLELRRAEEPRDVELDLPEADGEAPAPPPRPGLPRGLLAAAVALTVGVLALAWLVRRGSRALPPASPAASAPATGAATPSASPGATAAPGVEPLKLPPLGESDALVRELLARLSSHAEWARVLAAEDLVRRFAAVVTNVTAGENPRAHLRFLEPRERLGVVPRGPGLVVDPDSHRRFDALVEAFASLDAAACARTYRQLAPLFESAYRELGHPEGGFERSVRAAVHALLATPIRDEELAVRPVRRVVLVYEYVDPRLEALAPSQKQLLRLGPRNARRVQDQLRALLAALERP